MAIRTRLTTLTPEQRAALEEFQKLATGATFPEKQDFERKTRIFFSHKEKLVK